MNPKETLSIMRSGLKIHPRQSVPSPLKTLRTREEVEVVMGELDFKTGAEIGVAEGLHSEHLCKSMPRVTLLCVDPWIIYPESFRARQINQELCDSRYEQAVERLAPYDCTLVKSMAMDYVHEVPDESLDFVYIDGNHEFDWVMEDLINWSKKVRVGGIVGGHDFYVFNHAGVIEAVYAYTRAHNIVEWYVTRERTPSFYWVKQW